MFRPGAVYIRERTAGTQPRTKNMKQEPSDLGRLEALDHLDLITEAKRFNVSTSGSKGTIIRRILAAIEQRKRIEAMRKAGQ